MAKTAYEIWKENEEKKKVSKPGPRRDSVQYNKSNYRGESLTRSKNYDWEKGLLKNLPSEYGRSYDKKFESWAASKGMDKSEAREFRTWMDSKEDGVDTKNRLTDGILNLSNRRTEERAKTITEHRPKREPEKKTGFAALMDKLKKSEVGQTFKAAEDFFNPFDSVKARDAVNNFLNHEQSDKTKEFARGASRMTDSASLGLFSNLDKKVNDREPAYNSAREFGEGGGTDMITSGLGYLVPGLGAAKAVKGAGLGAKAGSTGLSRFGQVAREGAIAGAGVGAAEVGIREGLNPDDYNYKQNLAHVGIGAAAGAIADPLLDGAGQLASNGLARLAKGNVPEYTGKPSADVLEQLTPQQSNRLETPHKSLFDRLQSIKREEPIADTEAAPSLDRIRKSEGYEPIEVEPVDGGSLIDTQSRGLKVGRDYEPIEAVESDGGALIDLKAKPAIDQTKGSFDTFRSKVSRKAPKKKGGLFSDLRTQFIDDTAPLENIEKQITGKIDSAENSLYKQARLFKGSPAKAHLIVEEQLTPIINDIKKLGKNTDDLGDYALAVHAKDVNSKEMNSGFTNAEIDDVIKKLGTPEMEAARQKLVAVNNNVLEMLSTGDSPVLDPADVKAMQEKWPNYMSLFRSFDDDKIEFTNGLSKALSVGSSPIKKLQGSSRDVIDPVESIVKNVFKATSVADRNNVASKLGVLAKQDKDGQFIRKLADGEDAGRTNVISVMNKGKKEKYEVPPEVYTTMMNLDKESSNTLIKILQKPASALRAGATLTPEFSLRNPLRDVPNAFVVSESGFNPITDFTYGLVQSIGKGRTIKIGNKEFKAPGELYKQFVKENGDYGNVTSMDRELHRNTLKKAITESSAHYVDVLDPKTYTSLMKKMANPLNVMRNIADVSETATKVGEFRAATRKGASPQEAAYRARDIMDFGRAGVSVREANKVVAFLNANIQGKSKLYRAFKENPTKFIGKAVAAVTIPTIGARVAQETYANEKQREILDDAPQWQKDTFYLIPIPGTDQIARIPKPFDLAFAFSNTLERAMDYFYKNDKEAFDGWIKEGFSQAAIPTMLTGIAPIVEGMANYSFFRQGPIIPEREENMDFPDQYDVNTSETAKLVGKGINKVTGGEGAFKNFGSPRVVDNSVQGFFGGLGTYSTSIIDMFVNAVSDTDNPERPEKNIAQKPVAKAFLVNPNSSGASLDKLYTLKEKLSKARGSAKQNEKEFADEDLYDQVNDVTKEIGDLNKEIRSTENSKELSAKEKRNILEQLIRERNETARQAMKYLKE